MIIITDIADESPSIVKGISKSDELVDVIKSSPSKQNLTRTALGKVVKCADEAGIVLNKTSDIIKNTGKIADTGKDVWKNYGPCRRGQIIDELLNKHSLGLGLGSNFPVFDRLEGRKLINTKSLDLGASGYKNPDKLKKRLQKYIDKMNDFENKYPEVNNVNGFIWGQAEPLLKSDYDSKVLELV